MRLKFFPSHSFGRSVGKGSLPSRTHSIPKLRTKTQKKFFILVTRLLSFSTPLSSNYAAPLSAKKARSFLFLRTCTSLLQNKDPQMHSLRALTKKQEGASFKRPERTSFPRAHSPFPASCVMQRKTRVEIQGKKDFFFSSCCELIFSPPCVIRKPYRYLRLAKSKGGYPILKTDHIDGRA